MAQTPIFISDNTSRDFFLSPRMKSERSLINFHKTILKALRISGSVNIVMRTFRHMLLWGGEQSLWLCIL